MTERTEDMQPKSERLTWVEPEISALAIEETAGVNGVGGDGNPANVDCTRS